MSLQQHSSDAVLDVTGTLARFDGDEQLFREIIEYFLEDAPPLFAELRQAAEVSHAVAVRSAAHALKGLAAGCGGTRAAQVAQRIETAAEYGRLEQVVPLIDTLERELELMRQSAQAYCA